MDRDELALDGDVRASEVLESGDNGDAGGVDESAVVVEEVDVRAHMPAFLTGDDAEGFRVDGVGAADGFFNEARKEDFLFGLTEDVREDVALESGVEEGTGQLQRRARPWAQALS